MMLLFVFEPILHGFFLRFWKIQISKMANQDGRHLEMITQLLLHLKSSPHDTDVKGDIF